MPFAWSCSCGDGAASVARSFEDARLAGELHTCRMGRMRAEHLVIVRADA